MKQFGIIVITILFCFAIGVVIFHNKSNDFESMQGQLQTELDSIRYERFKLHDSIAFLNQKMYLQQQEFEARLPRQEERKKVSNEKISHTRTLSPDSAFEYFSGWVADTIND